MIVSERWQQEVAETVLDAINADTDKKRRVVSEDCNHTGNVAPHLYCSTTSIL